MSYKERMDAINEKSKQVGGLFLRAALDYERKVTGRPCSDIRMLRASMLHRLSAIDWHIQLMHDYESQATQAIRTRDGFDSAHELEMMHTGRMRSLFDDVVFNLMSLFDYTAGFIGYVFYGDEIRDAAEYDPLDHDEERTDHLRRKKSRIDWSNIRNAYFRRKLYFGTNRLKDTEVVKVIDKWEGRLLSPLRNYRNDIIHHSADRTAGGYSLKLMDVTQSEIFVHPPPEFKDKFDIADDDTENLFDSVLWLFEESLSALEYLAKNLMTDIEERRNVEKGEEHILFPGDEGYDDSDT